MFSRHAFVCTDVSWQLGLFPVGSLVSVRLTKEQYVRKVTIRRATTQSATAPPPPKPPRPAAPPYADDVAAAERADALLRWPDTTPLAPMGLMAEPAAADSWWCMGDK
ncbi:hypothetical protein EYF80_025700 [Liparis tanakae]|uniref:Uncharacterized protein n=1 Tax=Liparis tanakae TaxID=230148 RepID=A0A4Z2HGV6_9TELE|nr:hypothetical protein EYF80_025700 [Liparis tanakae]